MATQAIKYESTKIDATQSASEVAGLVQKYGGSRFELRWNDRNELEAIRFALRTEMGEIPIRIAAHTDGVQDRLSKAHPSWGRDQLRSQALRIAWRHIRDLTEQLLLSVDLGLKDVAAAFMDGVEVWDDEAQETITMAELIHRRAELVGSDRGLRLLPAGKAGK
jgi:hypothetical protein